MWFSQKDYARKKELEEVKSELSSIKLDFERIKTHITSLRGLVNRKLGGDREEQDFEEPERKQKSSYSGVLLPE